MTDTDRIDALYDAVTSVDWYVEEYCPVSSGGMLYNGIADLALVPAEDGTWLLYDVSDAAIEAGGFAGPDPLRVFATQQEAINFAS